VVVPSPSCPSSLPPQQKAAPPTVTAGVIDPRRYGGDARHAADRHRGRATVRDRAVPQLPVSVPAPTQRAAADGEGAGMCITHRNRARPARQAADSHRRYALRSRAVPQFPVLVVAPAQDAAAAGERAGVPPPRQWP
jgi:hypothetical protein